METGVVTDRWAIVLPLTSARALAALRNVAGLEVCVVDQLIWLQGDSLDAAMRKLLLGLPALDRYLIHDDEQLTPWNKLTPQARLPAGPWMKLAEWATLSLPPRGWPGERPVAVQLQLVRSGRERAAGALLCDWRVWADYATAAPQVRLEGLAFVANSARQTIIRGATLPPIPAHPLTDNAGILVPAGWSWSPAIDAAAVRQMFSLNDGETALWLAGESWQRIAADAWVAATRSAVRETAREVGND
jgi:hypothetical protein